MKRISASLVQQALTSVNQTHNAMGAIVDDKVVVDQMTTVPTPDIHESDIVALPGTDKSSTIQDANVAQVLAKAEGSVW